MKTIYKNELPPGYRNWSYFCLNCSLIGSMYILQTELDGRKVTYYIEPDYAKARAWDEYVVTKHIESSFRWTVVFDEEGNVKEQGIFNDLKNTDNENA